ncbi:MAG TPA: vanadium-dependent haloperoxidase [Longimicrobiales bacterium]
MRTLIPRLRVAILLALVAGCSQPSRDYTGVASDPELLHAAVWAVTEAMMQSVTSPPVAARTYAYSSVAAYEALRHGHEGYRSLAGQLNELQPVPEPEPGVEYLLPLAGVNAFLTVAEALVFAPEKVAAHRDTLIRRLRENGIPKRVLERSFEYGAAVARHVLDWAATDNIKLARAAPRLQIRHEPGLWVPTPPGYMDAVEPNWWMLRPFVLDSAAEVVPPPPVPYDMRKGSPFYRLVMEVYETGKNLTPEQRWIAGFWDCNPFTVYPEGHFMSSAKKITPGGHWMGITAIAMRQTGADMMRSAEAYARVAIALSDAFVSNWREKYRSVRVRPVTVIQERIDPTWEPLLQTPPFPEYTSGHSVISTAAAEVLTDLLGEEFAFTDDTELPFGIAPRSFRSFREAAAEAAISRLYGGIHYRDAIEDGVVQGRAIGRAVVARVHTSPPRITHAGSGDAQAGGPGGAEPPAANL